MDFPQRLKAARKAAGMTQKQVAEKLGISISAYQYYEAARSEPTLDKLARLAGILGVSTDFLLGREPFLEGFFDESQ